MSTRKGRDFEKYIRDYCNSLGLKAKRRKLSGADLKKPYDVRVRGAVWEDTCSQQERSRLFPLVIEAKRRMTKDSFTIVADWMDDVAKRNILVFAAGKRPGIKLRMVAVSFGDAGDGCPVLKMNRSKTIPVQLLDTWPCKFTIEYKGKKYIAQSFTRFLEVNGYLKAPELNQILVEKNDVNQS